MDKLGVYSDCYKNKVTSALLLYDDAKEYGGLVSPAVTEKKAVREKKNVQEYLYNAHGICMQEVAWGRVIQKGKISGIDELTVSDQDNRKPVQAGADAIMCAFAEVPTALELFQKARNMDWRNVEERTFATGSKIFDFTV